MVADGDQARGQQAHAALGPGKEILEHLVVGTAGLLGHLTVAHGGHDQPVLHRQLVDPDGREQRGVGIEVRVMRAVPPARFSQSVRTQLPKLLTSCCTKMSFFKGMPSLS